MKTKKRPRKAAPAIEETIVQTTYMVTIIAAKGTPETNLWIGRHFTPTINRAMMRPSGRLRQERSLVMSAAESSTNRSE
jgi:hypothetical protein